MRIVVLSLIAGLSILVLPATVFADLVYTANNFNRQPSLDPGIVSVFNSDFDFVDNINGGGTVTALDFDNNGHLVAALQGFNGARTVLSTIDVATGAVIQSRAFNSNYFDDIVVGRDGLIYVANNFNHQPALDPGHISIFDSNFQFVRSFQAGGTVADIEFDGHGNLVAAIHDFNGARTVLRSFDVSNGSIVHSMNFQSNYFDDLAVGRDGLIYVANNFNHQPALDPGHISIFDSNFQFVRSFQAGGTVAALEFDNRGNLIAALQDFNGARTVLGTFDVTTGSMIQSRTFASNYFDDLAIASVPEPASMILIGAGIMFCLGTRRTRNRPLGRPSITSR